MIIAFWSQVTAISLGHVQGRDRDFAKSGIRVDRAVKDARPDDWRGHAPRENIIKAALLSALGGNIDAVVQLFPVIVAQKE